MVAIASRGMCTLRPGRNTLPVGTVIPDESIVIENWLRCHKAARGNRDQQQSENAQDGGNEPGVKPNGESRRKPDEREEYPRQDHRYVNVDARLQYHGRL